ncbi:MAG: ankyrin repeat domain-containing protein [Methylococcales bacterium]|nr:ankyrin repeat domain-containing protein [Methylococcales bacterium]
MKSINPIYIAVLICTLLFVAFLKINNPYRKYSSSEYWEKSTLASVNDIPDDALKIGNKNGPVLMWAAMSVSDIAIIKALVERGADVTEADLLFSGTALTGAAGYSKHPKILRELVSLGAQINRLST